MTLSLLPQTGRKSLRRSIHTRGGVPKHSEGRSLTAGANLESRGQALQNWPDLAKMASVKRDPRHPTSPEARSLIEQLLAGPFRSEIELAKALGVSGRTFRRMTSGDPEIANMPPKHMRALRRLAAANLPRASADIDGSAIALAPPRSIDELIDLVLRAQQPGSRHLRDGVCEALAGNMVRMKTPAEDRHLTAILLAQLALLDGARGVESTLDVFRAALEDLADSTPSDMTGRCLRSMACTALGRAESMLAATHPLSNSRKEGIRKAIDHFVNAGAGLSELRRIASIPELPLIWAIDEHPDTRYAPRDTARRTPLSRFAGPPHRYLLWMKLALAFEYLVEDRPDARAADQLMGEAERHWTDWTAQMVRCGTLEEKHLTGKGWTLRLRLMQYLHLV